MSERVLAGCTQSGNCPGVTRLGDGQIAVTGALPGGGETTVLLPAEVFDAAARSWLRGRRTPWAALCGCASLGVAASWAADAFGFTSPVASLIGWAVAAVCAFAVGWDAGGGDD